MWICVYMYILWNQHLGNPQGVLTPTAVLLTPTVLKLQAPNRAPSSISSCRLHVLLQVLLQGAAVRVVCALCAMKLGCWCPCKGWLRDVYGSVGVGPWWRLRLCRSKKGKRLVATIKYLMISGVYAGGIIYIYLYYIIFFLSLPLCVSLQYLHMHCPARSWFKTWALGGRCTARCWKMEKGRAEIKMWEHVGLRWHKTGVWAWCFQIRFVAPKIASAGAETKIF